MSILAGSALRGVAWNWTGSAVLVVAQLGSTAATARLVSPREFGLYAAAQAIFGLAGFFSMRAVGQDLQRRAELGPRTVGTAVTVLLVAALLVGGALAAGASLWAEAWGVPDAAWAIRVFSLALMLQSLAVTPLALLRRELRFGRAASVETGAIVAGMAIGVGLAVHLHSAVALAIGQAAGAAILLAGSVTIARGGLMPAFDRADARTLFAFAGQIGGFGLLAYCASILPSWFVARQFGASLLGLFSRARQMAELPADYAKSSVYKVIFPLYGRVREDPARTRTLLREALSLSTGLAWPAFAFLAGAAPLAVEVVLGSRWADSAPLLALFCLIVCAAIPAGLLTNCAEAFGWMRIVGLRQGALLLGVALVLAATAATGRGAQAMLLGVAAAQWATYLATAILFARRGLLGGREALTEHAAHGAFALLALGVGATATAVASGSAVGIQALVAVTGALLACAVFAFLHRTIPAGRILAKRLGQLTSRPRPSTAS